MSGGGRPGVVENLDADLEKSPFEGAPDPEFEVLSAAAIERAAAPAIRFAVRATDASERQIFTIALTAVISIEPAKRRYEPSDRERLVELFGEPERWAATTTAFRWAQTEALVPAFAGEAEFDLVVPCTYDHEIAVTKYFQGLGGGVAPLRFHFNGTVLYDDGDGRMQMVQVPWDRSPRFELPLTAWRQAIDGVYPFRAWVPVHTETLARLARLKAERGLPTFDAAVDHLIDGAER